MNHSPPILVEVPVCAFRPYASREYQDTFPIPTPSSVYGMLLSLLGIPREEKDRHRGAELALAVERLPERSKVFRKLRRGSDLESLRPDYQDLLTELRLWLWLRVGADQSNPCLAERVPDAIARPHTITRCGGLSLGESSYLVDSLRICNAAPERLLFLLPDVSGFYSLPVWVDHNDIRRTVLERFQLSKPLLASQGLDQAWVRIGGKA